MVQPLLVLAGNAAAAFVFTIEIPEFDIEGRRLKLVKPTVVTLVGKNIFAAGTIVGQTADGFGKYVVVGGNRSPIAQSTQGLGRVKAVASGVA
jgi:hypothetical protein